MKKKYEKTTIDFYLYISLNFIEKFTKRRERAWRELSLENERDEIFISNLSHEWYYMCSKILYIFIIFEVKMIIIIIIIVSIKYAHNIWFYLLNKEMIINERKINKRMFNK